MGNSPHNRSLFLEHTARGDLNYEGNEGNKARIELGCGRNRYGRIAKHREIAGFLGESADCIENAIFQ